MGEKKMTAKEAAEKISELERQVAELKLELADMTAKYELIKEKRFNERGAGRKKNDEKWQERFHTFCELYKQRTAEDEIERNMGISRSTYYRFKRYYLDAAKITEN